MRRTWGCCWRLVVAVGATLGVWGAPAWAHVDAQPGQAPAGTEADVGFVITHGCDASPTTSLAIQLPEGVTGTPQAVEGFQGAADDGRVVRWTGGNLPAQQKQTFRLHLRLPNTPGATLYFPAIQSCQLGEIRWVEVPTAGQDPHQLESPAAVLRLTAGPPAQTEPRQPGASQPGAHEQRAAGTRPEGGVRAGAGGTAGPTLAGLLTVGSAGLLGAGVLFVRLRQGA